MSFAGGQNSNKLSMKSRNICKSLQYWFLLSKIGRFVYLSVGDTSIASVLVQKHDGQERVVFYLSRCILDAETRYPEIEKLCLCLYFTCTKHRHILLSAEAIVICKSDVIKHMLSAPVLKGRLGKWMFALSEFDI